MAKKKDGGKRVAKFLIGLGLIIFAVVPTPDDITVISPVIAFGFGTKLLIDALK